MSNIEASFIKKLLVSGEFAIVADRQITDRYFSGRYKSAFKYIREHQTQYGKVPDIKTFKKKFPNFPFPETIPNESMAWFCDEVRTKKKHNTIVSTLEDVQSDIEELNTMEAYEKIKKLVLFVENEIVMTDRMIVNRDTEKRKQDYLKRAKAGGMTGIPSFIDRLDYALKGFNKGELITLLGYTGIGKSWFEIIMAVAQARHGYKVLFFTTEMSVKMVMRRVDAVWANLSYTRFRDGRLHPEEYQRYVEYLEQQSQNTEDILIVEQATGGVSQISAKIDQYQPDIVYIDGGYLLADEESDDDDWKSLVRIWRGLHRLCILKDVPIFVSTQSKEKKVSLSAISFAKAISADCDVIIGIEQDEQMYEDRELKVTFHKVREGTIPPPFIMNWDFDKMNYSTIYSEGHDGFKEEQEKLQQQQKEDSREQVKNAGKARLKIRKPVGKAERPPGVQVLS